MIAEQSLCCSAPLVSRGECIWSSSAMAVGRNDHADSGQIGLRRAQPLRALPGHPARDGSRSARGVAVREARPAVHRPLLAALPGLHEHGCSYGEPGGFVRRLTEDEGTWLGHVLEHVAIELQNVAGEQVTFGKTRGAGRDGPLPRGLPVRAGGRRPRGRAARARPAALAAAAGASGPEGAVPPDFDFAAERDEFIRFAQRRALGPSTASLVRAAEERRIPWIRLNEQSLVQFGHGRYQQRIQATVTSRTSHIAVEIASDKEETNRILADLGLPVPRQRLVQRDGRRGRARRSASATRWWSSRSTPTTGAASRSTSRPRSRCATAFEVGARAQPQRHRRELHHRLRPPHAGGQRRAGRGGEARAGPRRGRRRAHRSSSWSRR